MCEEVILVPSGSVTDIEYFPVGMIFGQHSLKQRKCQIHPYSSMLWCSVEVVNELHWLAHKVN